MRWLKELRQRKSETMSLTKEEEKRLKRLQNEQTASTQKNKVKHCIIKSKLWCEAYDDSTAKACQMIELLNMSAGMLTPRNKRNDRTNAIRKSQPADAIKIAKNTRADQSSREERKWSLSGRKKPSMMQRSISLQRKQNI
jgi:hypothetical protein